MKISKLIIGVLFLCLALSFMGFAINGWQMLNFSLLMNLPSFTLLFSVKAICFIGLATIGFYVISLFRQYLRQGYFNAKSAFIMRIIGFVTIGVTLFNSLYHVLYQFAVGSATIIPPLKTIATYWLMNLFYEPPVMFFFSLLVFLFASFVGKAIDVKNEAETFI